jgi:hypothetical protein
VKVYRSKRLVEALRWTNTDENREQFAAWFDRHDAMFETRGTEIVLLEQEAGLRALITVGDWILCTDGDFVAMSDQLFTNLYDAAVPMKNKCPNNSPAWFTSHWHDLAPRSRLPPDDGLARSAEAVAEISQHHANRDTGHLSDAELAHLRARTTSGDTLLVRALDELRTRRAEATQRTAELVEALDIFDLSWCPEHGHAPRLEVFERIAKLRDCVAPPQEHIAGKGTT